MGPTHLICVCKLRTQSWRSTQTHAGAWGWGWLQPEFETAAGIEVTAAALQAAAPPSSPWGLASFRPNLTGSLPKLQPQRRDPEAGLPGGARACPCLGAGG